MNSPAAPCINRVALPVPLPGLFDYLSNPHQPRAGVGARVVVPFGRRHLVGIVVETGVTSDLPPERLLAIHSLLDGGETLLDSSLMNLLTWCWQYYKHAPGEVLQTALPPALRKPDGSLPAAPVQFTLTAEGSLRLQQGPGRAKAQFALLQRLEEAPLSQFDLSS
ncbi:MAG: primosomal protein N', partial [Lysobacterales bacterium]